MNEQDKNVNEVPIFIKVRGCINCDVSKRHKEETGNDYGYPGHEAMLLCLVGRMNYGHQLPQPFIDPEKPMKIAIESGNEKSIEITRKYLLYVEKRFGHFYEKIGVNLSDLV